jgi:hypothetical protein
MAEPMPGEDSETTQRLNIMDELDMKPRLFGMRLDYLVQAEDDLIHPKSSIDKAPDMQGAFDHGASSKLLDAVNQELQHPSGNPAREITAELTRQALVHPDGNTGAAPNAYASCERGALQMVTDSINSEMRNPSSDPLKAIGDDLAQKSMRMQASAIMADMGFKQRPPVPSTSQP